MDLRISKRAPVPTKMENTIFKYETRDRRNLNKFSSFLKGSKNSNRLDRDNLLDKEGLFLKAEEFKADTETRAPVTIPPLPGKPTNSINNDIISTNPSSEVRTSFQ